jgi:TatD DNase family protein
MSLGFDPHCHLQLSPLYEQAEALLLSARRAGVTGCLVPSYGPEEWLRQERLLELEGVIQALGIHPWCVPGRDPEDLVRKLDQAFERYPRVWGTRLRAVGEFGLDRAQKELKECFSAQKLVFQHHLTWAHKLSLPVILHVVKAHGAACELLTAGPKPANGVIHSFTGPRELLHQYDEFDLCFSYSGSIARAERTREALRHTPHHKIMFETDGPEGPAVSESGLLSPGSLPDIVALAAGVLGKSVDWCWSLHRENCRRVFGDL